MYWKPTIILKLSDEDRVVVIDPFRPINYNPIYGTIMFYTLYGGVARINDKYNCFKFYYRDYVVEPCLRKDHPTLVDMEKFYKSIQPYVDLAAAVMSIDSLPENPDKNA